MTLLKYFLFPSTKLMNEFTFVVEKYDTVIDKTLSNIKEYVRIRICRDCQTEMSSKRKIRNAKILLKLRACSHFIKTDDGHIKF